MSNSVNYSHLLPPGPKNRGSSIPAESTLGPEAKNGSQGASRNDWRALSYMFGGLIAGGALALLHHFMNLYLDQKAVATVPIPQEWISRFATILSFLNRMFLVITVGIAFVQHQWLIMHQSPLRIKDIDSLMTILEDLVPFLTSSVWFKHPLLTLIAVISWTIPLAAVITPGTLSITPLQKVDTTLVKVTQLAFDMYNDGDWNNRTHFIWGDEYAIKRSFNNAVTGSQYPQIPSAYPNQSYSLEFQGPALQCGSANSTVIEKFGSAFNGGAPAGDYSYYLSYAAWTGRDQHYMDAVADWGNWMLMLFNLTNIVTQHNLRPLDTYPTNDPAYRLFIATNQKTTNATWSDGYNVTECVLYNATYTAQFDFQYPNQSVKASVSKYHNPVMFNPGEIDDNAQYQYWESKNASAITGSANGLTVDDIMHEDAMGTSRIYSLMMEGLAQMLIGIVQAGSCAPPSLSVPFRTDCDFYNNGNHFFTSKHLVNIDWARSEAIQRGLEEVFVNATMSMFSMSRYTKSPADAEYVSSNVTTFPICYVYNSRDLILSYALAYGAAVFCMIIGFRAVHKNNASYQNLFSTFLRATSGTGLQSLIDRDDSGADPLPKQIGKLMVTTTSRSARSARYQKPGERDARPDSKKPLPRIVVVDEDSWI